MPFVATTSVFFEIGILKSEFTISSIGENNNGRSMIQGIEMIEGQAAQPTQKRCIKDEGVQPPYLI